MSSLIVLYSPIKIRYINACGENRLRKRSRNNNQRFLWSKNVIQIKAEKNKRIEVRSYSISTARKHAFAKSDFLYRSSFDFGSKLFLKIMSCAFRPLTCLCIIQFLNARIIKRFPFQDRAQRHFFDFQVEVLTNWIGL